MDDRTSTVLSPRRVSGAGTHQRDCVPNAGCHPSSSISLQRVRPHARSPGPSLTTSGWVSSPSRIASSTANHAGLYAQNSPTRMNRSPRRRRPIADRFIPAARPGPPPNIPQDCSQPAISGSAGSVLRPADINAPMRVLEFRPRVAQPVAQTDLRTQYVTPLRPSSIGDSTRAQISLPSLPERTLDAPGLADDFYQQPLAWSHQSQLAIILDGQVWIWNSRNGNASMLTKFKSEGGPRAQSVSWSSDGHLGIGTGHGDVQIWDTEAGAKLRSMRGRCTKIGSLCWNSHILTSGGRDGVIWHHDVRAREHEVAQLFGHRSEVCGLAWRAESSQIASGGNDNIVCIWDIRSGAVPRIQKPVHKAAVKALAWCPWQRSLLATGGGLLDKQIHLWNTTNGARVATADNGAPVSSLIWTSSSKELLSCGGMPRNQVNSWSWPSLSASAAVDAHESRILSAVLSPDGGLLATAGADEQLKFWRIAEQPRRRRAPSGMLDATKLSLR